MYIKEKKRKYYLTIYDFKFKYVKKKNLHEGNILKWKGNEITIKMMATVNGKLTYKLLETN